LGQCRDELVRQHVRPEGGRLVDPLVLDQHIDEEHRHVRWRRNTEPIRRLDACTEMPGRVTETTLSPEGATQQPVCPWHLHGVLGILVENTPKKATTSGHRVRSSDDSSA
jgi:hypothetical protein